jgi:putative flippase GtrA
MPNLIKKLLQIRLINFMIVGGIGFVVNMVVYYPLTLVFQQRVMFLNQVYYLPPFVLSSLIAITSNYFLNRISTFRGMRESRFGYFRYLFTYLLTLPLEMVVIFLLVEYLHLIPIAAVALAILVIFMSRYIIVNKFVWRLNHVAPALDKPDKAGTASTKKVS